MINIRYTHIRNVKVNANYNMHYIKVDDDLLAFGWISMACGT